uniref:Uncharacterized protein n=1 Tax=Anguilla anguilla TaxID=7936 RepID=A0A0E9T239_ANGAN
MISFTCCMFAGVLDFSFLLSK